MKNTAQSPTTPAEVAADRFALRVTARLSSGTDDLPYDISERLRASRMQALAKRKVVASVKRTAPASVVVSMGSAAALGRGSEGGSCRSRFRSRGRRFCRARPGQDGP